MSEFNLQNYKNTFANPATTGMKIMHKQWTVDEAYEIVAEVERLQMENDNFAHENHSLTGDVSAERERLEAVKKERDSYRNDANKLAERTAKAEMELEVQRPGWCPICHERIYNEVNKKIDKLEAEIAELKQNKIHMENDYKRLLSERDKRLTASEKKVEENRKYIHDLETRCDPAGDIQRMASLEDQVKGLTHKLEIYYEFIVAIKQLSINGELDSDSFDSKQRAYMVEI